MKLLITNATLKMYINHFYYRKIRSRDVAKVHFQLCVALLGMLVFFLIGIRRTENVILCTVMSLLIHYSTLASAMWMGAEAVLMFQKLIIIFGSITRRYFIVSSLICWCKFIRWKGSMFECRR